MIFGVFYNVLMDNNMPQNVNPVGAPPASPVTPVSSPMPYADPVPKKNKKPLIIVAIVLVLLLIAVGVGATLLLTSKSSNSDTSETTNTSFEKITKEQAFAFVKDYYGKNYVPDGFIDDEIKLKDDQNAYTLLYSYEKEADIPRIADESIMNIEENNSYPLEQRFKVKKVSDLYSTVTQTDKLANGSNTIRYLGICFNKEYVDYRQEEMIDSNGSASINDSLTLKKLDKDTAEKVLKAYVVPEVYGRLIHSYEFQDLENEYRLKVNFVGVGVTALNTTADHTVVTYYMDWSVNKSTGKLNAVFVNTTDYSRNFVVNSYKLNDKEYNELVEIMSKTSL